MTHEEKSISETMLRVKGFGESRATDFSPTSLGSRTLVEVAVVILNSHVWLLLEPRFPEARALALITEPPRARSPSYGQGINETVHALAIDSPGLED